MLDLQGISVEITTFLSSNLLYCHGKLYEIYPKLQLEVPEAPPRHLDAGLPRICMHIAYKRKQLHLSSLADRFLPEFHAVRSTVSKTCPAV